MHGGMVASGLSRYPATESDSGPGEGYMDEIKRTRCTRERRMVDGAAASGGSAEVIRHGRRWRVIQTERSVIVDHVVGMLHLAVLLANPEREIPAVELASGANALAANAGLGTRSAQPLLDQTAIRQYSARVAELRAEAAKLRRRGDPNRADSLRSEFDWLVGQLSAASGVRGRTRSFTDNTERARVAVGKAIRRAIDRIAEADPVIGTHLRDCVHTGMRCVYRPILCSVP